MRNFLSFAPAAVFFGAYFYFGDFYSATVALMLAVALQIVILLLCKLPPTGVDWTVGALVLVFGGATLLLRETVFLQMKTTVVNWLFACAFLISDFGFKKNLAHLLMGKMIAAPDALWRRVSVMLSVTFFFVGALNLGLVFHLSEESWVWVKTFVYPAITLVSVLGIVAYLAQNGETVENTTGGKND